MSDFDPNRVPKGGALYLHVPFCSAICDFCAFDKSLPSPGDWVVFRQSFAREWGGLDFEGKASSAFWGGGTPGLLKASDIRKFGEAFQAVLERDAEWTVELTPLCPTTEKLSAWREVGVNRLSLGVQSFSPRLLEAMGRPYSTEKISRIVERIRKEGFSALNIDLIIAFPGQTQEELIFDLRRTVELSPDHISVYCLTLEEDTALFSRLLAKGSQPDPEHEARLYSTAWSFLEDHGYLQYEISNFARPGFQCEHHLNVWRMGSWRGVGPSAASQIGHYRFQNPHGLREWAGAVESNRGSERFSAGFERIKSEDQVKERLVFGLRMNEGVPIAALDDLPESSCAKIRSLFDRLEQEGYLEKKGGRAVLSLAGRLVVDEISRWIFR